MKSIMKKSIVLLILALITFAFVASPAFAAAADLKSMISTIDKKGDGSKASASAENIVGAILNVCKVVAVGIALIMLVVLAMKYMSAAPGDKAEIKKSATIYITGAVILFASAGILSIIQEFANTNIKAS